MGFKTFENIYWILLYKPWFNSIKKHFKIFSDYFEDSCENILKNIFPKIIP
jgi:hypothetical protein